MPFRFNAKNAFLTYPRCSETPRALGEFLEGIRVASYIKVVRETHRDGTYHLHALIQWPDKINVRNERTFDFRSNHPNIQAARDVGSVEEYINKAIPANAPDDAVWTIGTISLSRKSDKWLKVAHATTEEECIEAALEASPRDFVLQHEKIIEYARKKQRQLSVYEHDTSITFNVPMDLITYMTNEFTNPVGLLPWIQNENHVLNLNEDQSVVLKRCCFPGQPGAGKPRGQGHTDLTFTGGVCLTSRHTTQKQST